jgi:MFS family permease
VADPRRRVVLLRPAWRRPAHPAWRRPAHPAWRARAVGVYRLWRDGGFAVGALLAGILADAYGIRTAAAAVAALTAASGLFAWARMYEPHPSR